MALCTRWFPLACLSGLLLSCSSSETSNDPSPAGNTSARGDHVAMGAAAAGAGSMLPAPPAGAKVMFLEPADGGVAWGPSFDGKVRVMVKMGVEGITLHPAEIAMPNSGHHHIIIDGTAVPLGDRLHQDDTHLHYGKGERTVVVQLTPGKHTLTLQFADGAEASYGPQLSSTISIDAQPK